MSHTLLLRRIALTVSAALASACSGDAGNAAATNPGGSSIEGAGGAGGAGGSNAGAGGAETTTSTGGQGGRTDQGGQGGGAGGTASAGGASAGGAGGTTSTGGASGGGGWNACNVDGVDGECIDVVDCTGDYAPTPGFCPGPANIQCCTKQGPPPDAGVCDPNASPEPNVGLVEAPGIGGCPPGMALVEAFCVDRFEASLVHAQTGESMSPFHNPGFTAARAVSIAGAVPQGYINQIEADDACTNAGKRLCTDDEWLRACRGPDDFTYPYGDVLELGVCNDHRAIHPAIEYFGTNAAWIWSELDNACLDQLPDSLDPAGANPSCVTAEGLYDMMGNLHEWTADPAGTFRGGYFVDTVINGHGCLYATTAHDVSHWDYSTGFRCCADP